MNKGGVQKSSSPETQPTPQAPEKSSSTPLCCSSPFRSKTLLIPLIVTIFLTVLVVGYWAGTKKVIAPRVSPSVSPQITPYPTPTPDPTANWKTYVDSKNNFSIKYPSAWYATPSKDSLSVSFSSRESSYDGVSDNVGLQFIDNPTNLTLDEYVEKEIKRESVNLNDNSIIKTPILIGNINGWYVLGEPTGPSGGLSYYIEFNSQLISVAGGPYWPQQEKEQRKDNLSPSADRLRGIAEAMISTLKSN